MAILQNEKLMIGVNERGQIDHLSYPGGQNLITRPCGLFRAVLKTGDNWENVAFSDRQSYSVTADEQRIVLKTGCLRAKEGEQPIRLTLTLRLEGERVYFDSEIDNQSQSTVVDWIYPCVGAMQSLGQGKMDLLFPRHMGERVVNVGGYLKGLRGREALHEMLHTYPGQLSMQWMLLEGDGRCLYFSGRDELIHTSALRVKGSEAGDVTLEMNRMAFVKPGECWKGPATMVMLYEGQWLRAAREYAAWASGWRHPVQPQEWMRRMNGYFLVINKQQYGDEIWPYDTIPDLYKLAQEHGFDVLGLFGWYHSGHDNRYPDLEVSPTMGGEAVLKAGIRKVQEMGGHVTLYYQGHLMDVGSEYYQKKGHLLEGKTRWGTPYYEYYDKFCQSDFLHHFSKKPFATICPSCTEWHELMAQRADWVHGFGADGILYDQIGGMPPYPCFDESHPHMQGRPSLSHTQGRIKLHKRIRAQVDSHKGFAYMTEHVTDVHSQFPDCLHGIGSYPGEKGSQRAHAGTGCHDRLESGAQDSYVRMMPEMFRYTFPETLITIRNPSPFLSRRFANYAFLYGYKLEMELRYQTDRDAIEAGEGMEERAYGKRVAQLRRQHEDFLLLGRFLATEGLTNDNSAVMAGVFQREDGRRCVALWNDSDAAQPVRVSLEGQALTAWASPEGEGAGVPAQIGPEEIMLLY
ncbi:MAG: DUF6259 domain-containing protein [Eubacteriales bacterium]|nr:DUF6259 domain-containing protein [Eubacteriales bacterium]